MLAIVIPYYKIAYFKETLNSLERQTNKNYTVYIGNDGSSEDPEEMINKYTPKLNLTYKKFDNNLGKDSLVSHWIRCIELAKEEEWVMVLGDDDYLGETVVEEWYNHYENFKTTSKVVRFASRIVTEETGEISEVYTHPVKETAADACMRRFKGVTRSSLSEYVFLKKAYLKYKFHEYPLAWHSDDRAWLEFSKNGLIYSINGATVFVRNSSLNISGMTSNIKIKAEASTKFHKFLLSHLYLFDKYQQEYLLRNFENKIKAKKRGQLFQWAFLLMVYIKNQNFQAITKFLKRFVKLKLSLG